MESYNFEINSSGIYVPASYSAYVRTDSPFLPSNIFHELYGHGLFVEHSQIGKKLSDIIKNEEDPHPFKFGKNKAKMVVGSFEAIKKFAEED